MSLRSNLLILVFVAVPLACGVKNDDGGDGDGGASDDNGGSESDSDTSPDTTDSDEGPEGSGSGPDTSGDVDEPVCDPVEDFTCTGSCSGLDGESGSCFTRCTPDSTDAIGQADDECTDPARPYCGQIGDSFGGDFDCNNCAHVCISTPGINSCSMSASQCGA